MQTLLGIQSLAGQCEENARLIGRFNAHGRIYLITFIECAIFQHDPAPANVTKALRRISFHQHWVG